MDPSLICKFFFSLGAAVSLGGTLIPSFRAHIMDYGSRSTTSTKVVSEESKGMAEKMLEFIGALQVPHRWFTHYYVVSVLSSLFWAFQIYTQGSAFKFMASLSHPRTSSMTVDQIVLAWLFMFVQGTRRLYESLTLAKTSQSKMWVGLWAIGIGYYIFMGISIWIEGIDVLSQDAPPKSLLHLSKPSLKTILGVPIFILASGIQHECHVHLASLKKYTLPHHYLFRSVVCPHYTSECMMYLALAIVSAPQGQTLNKTVLAGLGFVFTNLAVTADSTRRWYVEKFGSEKVSGRRRIIPYVF